MAKIISGFPGVGKTYFAENNSGVLDSDSSTFDKANFPENYIAHIKSKLDDPDVKYILVSSHKEVRSALVRAGLKFTLVYPILEMKEEFLDRYVFRKSPNAFVSLMEKEWTNFLTSCFNQEGCNHILLSPFCSTLSSVKDFDAGFHLLPAWSMYS